ncbi:hypothetical protein KC19_VG188900 [Ceratodon purpureus]|uniref:Uncharacterized protein n=1 Tax=Ceratodon purpureus TaxID=3225 RepID=A0A8T0HS43_CERPU|nr:hypothetical protein KC19_VG188900 [Ceratodon purpureus]
MTLLILFLMFEASAGEAQSLCRKHDNFGESKEDIAWVASFFGRDKRTKASVTL